MASNDECKEQVADGVDRKWLKIDPDAKISKYQCEVYSPFSPHAEINDWNLDFNNETESIGETRYGKEVSQLYSPFRADDVDEEERQFKILDYRNRNYNSISSSISVMYDYFFGNKKPKSKKCEIRCKRDSAKLDNNNLSEEEDIPF